MHYIVPIQQLTDMFIACSCHVTQKSTLFIYTGNIICFNVCSLLSGQALGDSVIELYVVATITAVVKFIIFPKHQKLWPNKHF